MNNKRIQLINEYLLRNTKTIYRLRKIQDSTNGEKEISAYAVALAKSDPLSLKEQVQMFYDNCKNVMVAGESLITEDRYFKITAGAFEVIYCLEAWRKKADKLAYIEDGQIKIESLHRMSCEQAAGVFKEKDVDPLAVIDSLEMLKGYSNPADKYAALAKFPLLLDTCCGEMQFRGGGNERKRNWSR